MKYSELTNGFLEGKKYRREGWAYDAYVYFKQAPDTDPPQGTLMLAIAGIREVVWICEAEDRILSEPDAEGKVVEVNDWVEYVAHQSV